MEGVGTNAMKWHLCTIECSHSCSVWDRPDSDLITAWFPEVTLEWSSLAKLNLAWCHSALKSVCFKGKSSQLLESNFSQRKIELPAPGNNTGIPQGSQSHCCKQLKLLHQWRYFYRKIIGGVVHWWSHDVKFHSRLLSEGSSPCLPTARSDNMHAWVDK